MKMSATMKTARKLYKSPRKYKKILDIIFTKLITDKTFFENGENFGEISLTA